MSQRVVAGHCAGGSRGGPFSAPVPDAGAEAMPLLDCSRQGLGECEEPGRCSQGAFFTRGPRPSFASRQPLKTCDHSHCGELAFVGNSGGDGLRGKGHIPKIMFAVGIIFYPNCFSHGK